MVAIVRTRSACSDALCTQELPLRSQECPTIGNAAGHFAVDDGTHLGGNDEEEGKDYLLDDRDLQLRLLSLVGLMEKELVPHCYKPSGASVFDFHALPCLRLLELPPLMTETVIHDALEELTEGLGDIFFSTDQELTRVRLHWDNRNVHADGEGGGNVTVRCEFCAAVEREVAKFQADARRYLERRDVLVKETEQRVIDEGIDRCKARAEARKRVKERLRETDDFYPEDLVSGDRPKKDDIVEHLCWHKKMPLLHAMTGAHDDEDVIRDTGTAAFDSLMDKESKNEH